MDLRSKGSYLYVRVDLQIVVILCCTAFTTRGVLNCQKIRNCNSYDIDTNIDANQIMKHICINMINICDFDPFNAWTNASLPLSAKQGCELNSIMRSGLWVLLPNIKNIKNPYRCNVFWQTCANMWVYISPCGHMLSKAKKFVSSNYSQYATTINRIIN